MNIGEIDVIDKRIASQILELDLSHNRIRSLQNIGQFKSLSKVKLSFNLIESAKELYNLQGLE